MKTMLALGLASLVALPAFAQTNTNSSGSANDNGTRHMIEFNADSVLQAVYSFDKSKYRNHKAYNDNKLNLNVGYAYALPTMPQLQIGGRLNYLNQTQNTGDVENWGFQVGAIWNHSRNLLNTFYASIYTGLNWNRTYATSSGNLRDEVWLSTFAVGHRFPLTRWGIEHVVYTPEIALQTLNSTTGAKNTNLEYTQNVQLRLIQFSVFF